MHYSAHNLSWSETEGGICLIFRKERTPQAYALVILAEVPALYITLSVSRYISGALHIKHSSFISNLYISIQT
jgi:hypothetical protein